MLRRLGCVLAIASLSFVGCSADSGGSGARSLDDGGSDASISVTAEGGADATAPTTDAEGSDAAPMVAQIVGASGGTVSAGGIALNIPAGALTADLGITIQPNGASVPAGYTPLSALFTFGPDGTVFQKPVTVNFTLTTPGTNPTVFWSNASGGYDALATTATATTATASVMHFSRGFCGEGQGHGGVVDAGVDSAVGRSVDSGVPSDSGASTDTGATVDSGAAVDSGIADAGASDAAALDSSIADGGFKGITVTIGSVVKTFTYNPSVTTNGNSVYTILADDNPASPQWELKLVVFAGTGATQCQTSIQPGFPAVSYTHFTNGAPDTTYTTLETTGSCVLTRTSTSLTQAQGSFSGTMALVPDAGLPDAGADILFSNGTYNLP
jgi:hypothetical protein